MDEGNLAGVAAMNDAQLIQSFAGSNAYDERARAAMGEFYRRYAEGLFAHCRIKYRRQLRGRDETRCFVGAVFLRFRQYAHRFDVKVAKQPEELAKLVRCWLSKQAEWTIREWMTAAENKEASNVDVELVGLSAPKVHRRSPRFISQLRRLRAELATMPAKDRDIIRTSYKYHDPEADTFLLPDHVQDELCTKWGFPTRNALVQYRLRKLKQLRGALLEWTHVA